MRIVLADDSTLLREGLASLLTDAGYEVVAVSRGQGRPYAEHWAWDRVQRLVLDRGAVPPQDFARAVADLDAQVVVDLIALFNLLVRQLLAQTM